MDDTYYPAIDYHKDAKPSYFPLRNIIYMYIYGGYSMSIICWRVCVRNLNSAMMKHRFPNKLWTFRSTPFFDVNTLRQAMNTGNLII